MKHSNIPVFIPELACPHQCVFCNQTKISGALHVPNPLDIPVIVDSYLSTMNDGREVEIAFFGGSFTGLPLDLQEQYLAKAFPYYESGRISGIRLSTRPDYISQPILDLLKRYGVKTIELGAQSTHEEVLLASGRGHDREAIWRASELIRRNGFHLGLQMMIGLPKDTFERSSQTVEDIISLGADNTRIYPTLVIKGTALGRLYATGRYEPLDLSTAVSWSKDFFLRFEQAGVTVLRVGLHPSAELSADKSLLAGPYHPSFKELMMTQIWRDILSLRLEGYEKERLILQVHPTQINFVFGYERKNRILFEKRGLDVKVLGNPKFSKYEIEVSCC
jgi:histone acetyltransferase (RNA polymerase elongator complex component)